MAEFSEHVRAALVAGLLLDRRTFNVDPPTDEQVRGILEEADTLTRQVERVQKEGE